jgi:hypothetical protein
MSRVTGNAAAIEALKYQKIGPNSRAEPTISGRRGLLLGYSPSALRRQSSQGRV